jgi:NADPH2:quinone reductase
MRAIAISHYGAPEVLKPVEFEKPVVKSNEVLIKVSYAGVNRPDCLQRSGAYMPPKDASPLPGLEVAGEIVAVGKAAKGFTIGQKVCALTAGGGYAEYVAVDYGSVLPIPKGLSELEAAALPENYFTVWYNVFMRGKLKKGETLLIHGGSSGIGTTALQLAKAFGVRVFVTVGNEKKGEACLKLGADGYINYKTHDFLVEAMRLTENKGVDVILDMVGGDYIERNYKLAKDKGRIIQIAFLKEPKVLVDFRLLMMKRLTHTGSTLRPRTFKEKREIARSLYKNVWELLESKAVKPLIEVVLPLEEAAKAHQLMEESQHIGKIMLKL